MVPVLYLTCMLRAPTSMDGSCRFHLISSYRPWDMVDGTSRKERTVLDCMVKLAALCAVL
ncbi:MAG: hypothetical protein A4E30_00575 [Methanomassiliicoccales archaeon PtaB.Bin215]|nr:MAG: hypothetical protein A4E30_00575 [Methanomassiliicoccales archaeon PtaB.Bin215]